MFEYSTGSDGPKLFQVIVVGLASLLILFLAFQVGSYFSDLGQEHCRRKAVTLNKPYKFELGSGCLIEAEPGKWVLFR